MMPPWIPLHLELVLFTGIAEIAGAMLAVYFLAVFRLPLEPLAILWALYASGLVSLRKLLGLSGGGLRA